MSESQAIHVPRGEPNPILMSAVLPELASPLSNADRSSEDEDCGPAARTLSHQPPTNEQTQGEQPMMFSGTYSLETGAVPLTVTVESHAAAKRDAESDPGKASQAPPSLAQQAQQYTPQAPVQPVMQQPQ